MQFVAKRNEWRKDSLYSPKVYRFSKWKSKLSINEYVFFGRYVFRHLKTCIEICQQNSTRDWCLKPWLNGPAVHSTMFSMFSRKSQSRTEHDYYVLLVLYSSNVRLLHQSILISSLINFELSELDFLKKLDRTKTIKWLIMISYCCLYKNFNRPKKQ